MPKREWKKAAQARARTAHTYDFPSRWGTYPDKKRGAIAFFNNWPYARYPLLREQQLAEFRRYLEDNEFKDLAYATYPVGGPDDGYTYAMIVQAHPDDFLALEEAMEEILLAGPQAMSSGHKGPTVEES
jgi:hypothetical protein